MKVLRWVVLAFALPTFLSLFPASQSNKYIFLKGSLVGVVYNEAGLTVSRAEVVVKGIDYEETVKTDGQGRFNIRKLPTGVYQLSLASSNPEMTVKKEVAIHLGKESYVSLVRKTASALSQPGNIEPVFFRDSDGKVLHQETIIGDRMYSIDYTYDLAGRVSTIRDSYDQEWNYEYTASGKIRKVTRPDKKTIYYNYDKDDQLVKIDLPWGYKVFYEKKNNQYLKTVKKYKNQILYQFVYSLDSKGNKVKVEDGSSQKSTFEYFYDGNDNLKVIRNSKTGEVNSNVVEYKGKVKNGDLDGAIENKNGKFQDLNYEYAFDIRGNIVSQKEKRGDMKVQRQFNQRDLLIRETYLSNSVPALTVEYAYDTSDRLIAKTINNRIQYLYYRDQDGHVLRKSVTNILTGEEKSGIVYTPFHSDLDQDGFELIKYDKTEKLLIRDAEGNARYQVDITDVMKHKIILLERQVNMDGDYWGGTESFLGLVGAKTKRPNAIVGKYCVDFYDLPLNETDPLGEEGSASLQVEKTQSGTKFRSSIWPGMNIGCYGPPMASPMNVSTERQTMYDDCDYSSFDYCVDCNDSYIGDDLGGSYDCYAGIDGPGIVDINQIGTFSLDSDCNSPSNIGWYGGTYGQNYGLYYDAFWNSDYAERTEEVDVHFQTTSYYTFTDSNGHPYTYCNVDEKETYTYVFIHDPNPPPPPEDVIFFEMGGGDVGGNYASIQNNALSGNSTFIVGQSFHCWVQTVTFNGQDWSWNCGWSGYGNSGTLNPGSGGGKNFYCTPNPSPAPNGRSEPLRYTIRVEVSFPNGETRNGEVIFEQDYIDKLRQEYLDLPGRPWVPMRSEFDQDSPYHSGLLGDAADSNEHGYWHIIRNLNGYAGNSDYYYALYSGNGINFISGYRCPIGNERTSGHADNSRHQYGRAFDFQQIGACGEYEYYKLWQSVRDAGASEAYIRGTDGTKYWNPTYPSNISYAGGHAQW